MFERANKFSQQRSKEKSSMGLLSNDGGPSPYNDPNHYTKSQIILPNFGKGSFENQTDTKSKERFDGNLSRYKAKIKQLQQKLEQKNQALQYFKEKSVKLEKSLENTKIFLNMVIHDLRNPTNQVEFLVSQSVKKLKAM